MSIQFHCMPSKVRLPFTEKQRRIALWLSALLSVGYLGVGVAYLVRRHDTFGIVHVVFGLVWLTLTIMLWSRRPRSLFAARRTEPRLPRPR